MHPLTGFAWLLLFQSAGEVFARLTGVPFPGPVIGMLLLVPALFWTGLQRSVGQAADSLLPHLSLLFVPIGVGVVTHLDVVIRQGTVLIAVLALSTWIGMWVTAVILKRLWSDDGESGLHR